MDSSSRDTLSKVFGDLAITRKMDSSSRDTLSKLFGEIIKWRQMFPDEVKFKWSDLHLSVVRDYILKLVLDSNLRVLNSARLFRDPLGYEKRRSCRKYPKIVASFTQELQEFFIVPSLDQLFDKKNTLKKDDLIAAFINFLLQFLSHKTDLIDPLEDQMDRLQKELRFIFTVLGDKSLLCDCEHEQVENLLAEFERVANGAGELVHYYFFDMHPESSIMDQFLSILFKDVGHLKDIVINMRPGTVRANISPNVAAAGSLFIVDSLIYDLEDLLKWNISIIIDVKDLIQNLHQELLRCQFGLKGIDVPQHLEVETLEDVEIRISDVAYEAEFLINSFLVGDSPLSYLSVRLRDFICRIQLISCELKVVEHDYNTGAVGPENNSNAQAQLPLQANRNSEVDNIIVGFEHNEIHILEQLLGDRKQLQIISIYGMPGLGKTTLAKKLYNHPSVRDRFDKRSWCVVSQTYQRQSLLTDILINSSSEFTKDDILNMGEGSLIEHIHKSLKGRRYLILVDDIWDVDAWDGLRRCLPDDGNGSRILFTSRNKEVAPPNSIIYPLPTLSNDQCWELLKRKVFPNEPCPLQLLEIGKEIAANCSGLPLAVVVIAGILSAMDKEESTWGEVSENVASYISCGGNNSTMQILELSYKHLPKHLKPCFLYFGAFPEDTEIAAGKLMKLWIAEGFVHKKDRRNSESVAEEYLMKLIDKSLVMVTSRRTSGGVKSCVVHDLLRDLCLKISEKENFLKLVDNNYSLYEKGHRLLSLQHSLTPFGQHVRSFHGYLLDSPFYVHNMRLLRVLDFERMISHARLFGIEFLVQLRYLVTNELPASIGRLVNLEYLRVVGNNEVAVRIPFVILQMVKLRYLEVKREATFGEDCSSSQTNNLEVLSNVIIKELKDEEMLKSSPHLRKLKCTCQPSSSAKKDTKRYLDLHFLSHLESLNVKFYRHRMAEINFPSNIKKLSLSGLCLPWEKMSIIGGLHYLEVLKLGSGSFVGEIWETEDGEFQQLRFLKLVGLELTY